MYTNYRDQEDFGRRLKALTGSDNNEKLVNKSIRFFNPFRNKSSCYYDETLKIVVENFRKHLDWDKFPTVSEKLSIASEALTCPILLIQEYKKLEIYENFKKSAKNIRSCIVLIPFVSEDSDTSVTEVVYNFMIDGNFGRRLKSAALKYYLDHVDLPKKIINVLTSVVNKENNFIKIVLSSKYKRTILNVYSSPFIVSKLLEFGYEMDPRAKDSDGFCGLYYALISKDPVILYKLYYFVVDNCCQTEVSFRNPDSNAVINLQNIEELLLENMSKLKDSNIKRNLNELLKLNAFLIKVNGEFLEIKNRINCSETTSDIVFDATKRRDFLVSLLESYKIFFYFDDNPPSSFINDYISHKEYYNSVDIVTAIIFFDNISFLKERLKLPNGKLFSDVESSFFSFIYYNIFANRQKINLHLSEKGMSMIHGISYMVLFTFRFQNFNILNEFSKVIHEINISEDNIITHIPESEIHSVLRSQPEFKNLLEFYRLNKYVKYSKYIRVMDIKEILTVERTLQVIGEYMPPEEKDFSFKRFLSLCLPKEISHNLRRLRNVVTHLKGHAFPSKFKCEKNASLFRSILSEIHEIDNYFKPIFDIFVLNFRVYVHFLYMTDHKEIRDNLQLYSFSHVLSLIWNKKCNVTNSDFFKKILMPARTSCHNFFKIALINLEQDIKSKHFSSESDITDMKQQIIYILWPLKWLIELLNRCEMDGAPTLLKSFVELESSSIDSQDTLREKTYSLIKECYEFLPKFNVVSKTNITKPLKSVKYINLFLQTLKGFVYLSDEEKDEIRNEIPEKIKKQVSLKDQLIRSIKEGFTLDVDVQSDEFELTYLSKKKMKELKNLYKSKDPSAHTILQTQDPIMELEEIFTNNSVHKKKYDTLCDIMQFSEKTRKKLGKLVLGQRKKVSANNLLNLLQRIQLLKKIVIHEDEEVHELWLTPEQEKYQHLIDEKIVRRYLSDYQFKAAIEMLLFDCMILFEGVKLPQKLWNKSSKLYQGINMRNILSHGNPLVEKLCEALGPQELPSEIVKKILFLIKGEDAVKAILELHGHVNKDYTKVSEIIYCDEEDEFCELRGRIRKCSDWKNFVLLLPDTH